MSLLNDTLSAVKTAVDSLSLTVNGNAVTSIIRKLPLKTDNLNSAVEIIISASEDQPPVKPFAFGKRFLNTILVEITLVAINNLNQVGQIADYSNFKETVSNYLSVPSNLSITGLLNTRVNENRYLDRDMLRVNYDYIQLLLEVQVVKTVS